MFNKYSKLKGEIKEIKEALIGVNINGNSFDKPASYSALKKLEDLDKKQQRNDEIISMLLDELGFSLEEGLRLVKTKKSKVK